MFTTDALQSVLAGSYYGGTPNSGSYAQPSIVSADPTPAYTASVSGTSVNVPGLGNLSLGMLCGVIIILAVVAWWVHPISA
jgi:hypothetical protein